MTRFRRFAALLVLTVAALATIATSPPYDETDGEWEDWWIVEPRVELDGVVLDDGNPVATWEYQAWIARTPGSDLFDSEAGAELLATIEGATEETEIRVTLEVNEEPEQPVGATWLPLVEESFELAAGAQVPYSRTISGWVAGCDLSAEDCSWGYRLRAELVRGGPLAIDPTALLYFDGPGSDQPVVDITVGAPVDLLPAT